MFVRRKIVYLFVLVFIILQGTLLFSKKWQHIINSDNNNSEMLKSWEEVFTGCVRLNIFEFLLKTILFCKTYGHLTYIVSFKIEVILRSIS